MRAAGADPERVIRGETTVNGTIEDVWAAWTTEEGIRSFFAPDCRVELKVGGPFEMYFLPDAEPGSRGGEGNRILAFEPPRMLSFTWNAPPSIPSVREQRTHVTLRFHPLDEKRTRVVLIHDGWGEGEDWDKAYAYFERAWLKGVLPWLRYRFDHGPVDWMNPPKIEG
ncbi:MAG: SRPBCC domain-containing protein [Candidatus Eisenbacteria bacterium]|nr:SRPBCC domain-containing protein [Candidatus Eisenbacteria bacterium]